MVNYLNATLNDTDAIGEANDGSFWDEVSCHLFSSHPLAWRSQVC